MFGVLYLAQFLFHLPAPHCKGLGPMVDLLYFFVEQPVQCCLTQQFSALLSFLCHSWYTLLVSFLLSVFRTINFCMELRGFFLTGKNAFTRRFIMASAGATFMVSWGVVLCIMTILKTSLLGSLFSNIAVWTKCTIFFLNSQPGHLLGGAGVWWVCEWYPFSYNTPCILLSCMGVHCLIQCCHKFLVLTTVCPEWGTVYPLLLMWWYQHPQI